MEFSAGETTVKAFELAYFVHRDHDLALQITKEAWAALNAHLRPQRKRFYYRLRGRGLGDAEIKARTKITLENAQKLQSLIYIKSDQVERQQEERLTPRDLASSAPKLTGEDWLIRFIKHLVAITVTRSSFYVTLGISRVLFNYSTEESVRVYDAIIQDPDRMKDAPYFRKRKNDVLMKGLKERFGNILQTRLVVHGEERFKCRPDGDQFGPLVEECLDLFTPWDTSCVLPDRLDPTNESIEVLSFNDDDPDREHRIETRRIHTLIHPPCFERLVQALGLASPNQRLEIPMFFTNKTENNQSGGRNQSGGIPSDTALRHPDPLTAEDFSLVEVFVQREQKRRNRAKPVSVSVMIDGGQRALLELDHQPTHLTLTEGERLVEIKAKDEKGELLLGSILLDERELLAACPARDYRLKLAGRRELCVLVTPKLEDDEIAGAELAVVFRRAPLLAGSRKLGDRFGHEARAVPLRPVFTLSAIAVLLAALVVGIVVIRRRSVDRDYLAQVPTQSSLPSASPVATKDPGGLDRDSRSQDSKIESIPPTRPSNENPTTRKDEAAEGTRSAAAELSRELATVRRVHLDDRSSSADGLVRDSLLKAIAATGKLQAVDDEHADAFLLWQISRGRLEVRLLNRVGQTLWRSSRLVHTGTNAPAAVAAEMVSELSAKIGQ